MLFFGTVLSQVALAGDENDPEIADEEKDVIMWTLYKGSFVNTLFKNVDILSCWFHENPEEPDNFYITFKMRDIRFGFFNTTYAARRDYGDKSCFAFFGHKLFNKQLWATVGFFNDTKDYKEYKYETIAEADIDTNTLTVTVPKMYVANPGNGDVLSNPVIGVYLIPHLTMLFPQLTKFFPHASIVALDEALDGRNYIIQY